MAAYSFVIAFITIFTQRSGINKISSHSSMTVKLVQRSNDIEGRVPSKELSAVSRAVFFNSLLAIPTAVVASTNSASNFTARDVLDAVDNANMQITRSAALEESVSGFIAGATLTLTKTFVKYPLDTATVRLQMPDSTYSVFNLPELFKGCYRGVLPPLIVNVPGGAVFFAVKDACKVAVAAVFPELPRLAVTISAVAVAQVPYWLIRNPSEVVKTRQQAGIEGYTGDGTSSLDGWRKVFKDGASQQNNDINDAKKVILGLRPFYTGFFENIIYAFPADVIKFVAYEQITKGRKNLPPLEGAAAGAFSTGIAQLITTPLDVVRNRLMADVDPNKSKNSQSYLDTLMKLGAEEGLSGLFAGATPRVWKAMLSGAIQFATYEETKQEITKIFQRRNS